MESRSSHWKKCSICKNEINYRSRYWVCSVSTCNGKRTGLVFCSTNCFERHLPGARHKDAAAVQEQSPAFTDEDLSSAKAPVRRVIRTSADQGGVVRSSQAPQRKGAPRDTLVVVSKLKDYVKAVSEMNTSGSCNSVISDIIRAACDRAIENARKDGRKTVLDRDFK